jgi:putative ABC transport system permease protein
MALAGIAIGAAGALALTRLVEKFLFATPVTDPVTYVLVPAVLVAVALLACYIPARRAMRLDPISALRHD